MARIVLVEDEINVLQMTKLMLTRASHEVRGFSSGQEAMAYISAQPGEIDVVLTDYRLTDSTGLDVLHAVKRADPGIQVLLVTAYATTATAIEAMRGGAFDYVEKPFKRDEILALVAKAHARRITLLGSPSPANGAETEGLPNFIGESDAMKEVMSLVTRVAPTKANILITGESGTGKEVVARAIHQLSGATGPFVAVNCGAIPEALLESEFFGHARGAFTGAVRDKVGFFQAAAQGSIFLDEIGELPMPMQVKLLRVIQEKKSQRVGDVREEPVTARIIAATNRDLRAEVDAHRFREDLFFRLNVIQISLPPLRERRDDIPRLIRYFLGKFNDELGKRITSVSREVLDVLMAYDYRGNVRELENILEHATTLELGPEISRSSLPAYLRNDAPQMARVSSDSQWRRVDRSEWTVPEMGDDGVELEGIVEDVERSLIEQSLERTQGNKTEAARLVGITFRSLRYRLKKYGLE